MSDVHTTVKTNQCTFSEYTIYPGRGIKYVGRDGKAHLYLNHRMKQMQTHLKRKALRLTWTQQWRRAHKKGRVIEHKKKKHAHKGKKVVKAIFGVLIRRDVLSN